MERKAEDTAGGVCWHWDAPLLLPSGSVLSVVADEEQGMRLGRVTRDTCSRGI